MMLYVLTRGISVTVRTFLGKVVAALALVAMGAVAMAAVTMAVGVPDADACSLVPTFDVSIDDLAAGDTGDLFAHLEPDYFAWSHDVYGEILPDSVPVELPALTGVWYERAVVAVDPPDGHYASVGGVTVVDAIWGQVDDIRNPIPVALDTSSCAGEFPLAEPGAFHLVTNSETWFPLTVRQPETAEQITAARELFDLAFGAPEEPARTPDAEADALDQVLTWAARDGVGDHQPPRWLNPLATTAEPTIETSTGTTRTTETTSTPVTPTSEGGTSTTVLVGIGAATLAAIAVLALGLKSRS